MLIAEKAHEHDGQLVIEKIHANDPYLRDAEIIRAKNEDGKHGENVHVGRFPMHLLAEWFKEAGVRWDDHEACREVLRRKILSGEVDKLRQWKGNF